MLTDDIRAVAVPRLLSSIQSSGMPSAEKKSKTRPFWSYYNPKEIKALYGWGRDSRVDFPPEQGVQYKCD
jgi:hypothetical protein